MKRCSCSIAIASPLLLLAWSGRRTHARCGRRWRKCACGGATLNDDTFDPRQTSSFSVRHVWSCRFVISSIIEIPTPLCQFTVARVGARTCARAVCRVLCAGGGSGLWLRSPVQTPGCSISHHGSHGRRFSRTPRITRLFKRARDIAKRRACWRAALPHTRVYKYSLSYHARARHYTLPASDASYRMPACRANSAERTGHCLAGAATRTASQMGAWAVSSNAAVREWSLTPRKLTSSRSP